MIRRLRSWWQRRRQPAGPPWKQFVEPIVITGPLKIHDERQFSTFSGINRDDYYAEMARIESRDLYGRDLT